nr:ribonuclease H-like domain, reverse transcriptase, RNA-dependent DNA polymerase [Tanacetum cinerariifolium]
TQDADSDSDCNEQVIIVPFYPSHSIQGTEPKDTFGDEVDDSPLTSADEIFQNELARLKGQEQRATSDAGRLGLGFANDAKEFHKRASAKTIPPGSIPVPTGSIPVPSGDTMVSTNDVPVHTSSPTDSFFDNKPIARFPSPSDLGNHDPSPGIFSSSSYDDEFGATLNNVASTVKVSPVATKRINTVHPQSLIIGDHTSAVQTRSKEEMQQFKFQNVWILVDLPGGKYAIGTKWILKNKKDARGIVVRNKARLVAQGHRQEEDIDYDKVFSLVARIEAIRLFLAFASYMGFMVYQMDVKSAFLYGRIDEEVYVTQPKGFLDPQHPKKVYKNKRDIILVQFYVVDIIFRSTKKAWCDEFKALMKGKFQMSAMGELTFFLGLQVQQRPDGMFISQDKYVQDILTKFDLGSVRTTTTPYEAPKTKSKTESDSPVNVHLYRSIIGSLMYLTASRPDIMFAVSACSRNQVTPTTSNLEAVKKIFTYLKGQPKLGLWYHRESPFVLEAYSNSDYAGENKDRKSTTGVCQFLGRRLILWQCKKQTIVTTSSTEAEYVDAANCYGQVLWIQNQLLDYRSPELGPPAIQATINKTPYTISEDLVRSQLQLADDGGIDYLPIAEIYSGMDNLGYVIEGKLTFFKNKFSPQWRFLVHTILHCLSTKSGSWDQFGSPLVVALICLYDGRKFNWSSYIFKGMVSNIGNAKKFLIYPRFLQAILGIETRIKRQYNMLKFSSKLFANMRLNFEGHPMPLLAAMLFQDQEGEGAGVAAQAVPQHMPAPDQPQDHLSTPPRQQTSDPTALVFEQRQCSDLNIASFSRTHETDADPFTNKVNTLETELKDHKKLFKDVVGKLVKKVKAIKAAKRLHDEEQAQVDRQKAELQRRRQQEVLTLAMYYTEADWINIMAQVEANTSLSKTLLGHNLLGRRFSQKSTEAHIPSVLEVPPSPVVYSPKSSGTRRKSLGRNRLTKPKSKLKEFDLDADDQTFIKVVSNEDSEDEAPLLWSALVGWEGPHMPLLAAMLSQDQKGEGAGVAAQAVPKHMHAPDQPQDHLPTPPRQQTYDPNALVFEHGQSSDPNIASFSRTHKTDDGPFTNVEDKPLGGSFHMSPPRSTQAPPAGQTSGGAEDLIILTGLSSVVSTLVQKVNSLETELKDHKKLFKDVAGKLVKKVKAMEQDVDLDALRALANAAVTVDSNIPPGGASNHPAASTSVPADVLTSANVPTGSTSVPADVTTSGAPAGVSNKGKAPMMEEDIPVKERTFKQMEDDRLGAKAAKRLHDEEQAQVDRQRAEMQRRRQQEVLASAMYYTEADWLNIIAQVEANASLSTTLLGDDVSEDNFPARMAALIKKKKLALAEQLAKERRNRPMTQGQQRTYMRQFVKNQSSAVYSTGWSMAYVKSFTDDQLKAEFEKIQKALSHIQIQAINRTLKRTGPVLEEPSSKRQKSTEALIPSMSEVPQSPVVSSPTSSGTRRKSLGRMRLTKPKSTLTELDLDAYDQTFIKVVSNEDSEDEAPLLWSALVGWEAPLLWSALVGWEVIPTPLGDINALYRIDRSTAYFTTLREILHIVDTHDLLKLYGLVVKYYENHPVAGIRSWRLYTLSNVHVLETVSGEVVYMFADVSYPFSVKLMERMLKHKLEIDKDVVGNDMTAAEQLIRFIKNHLAVAQVSSA